MFVITKGLLEVREVPVLMRESYGPHALNLTELGVFHGELDGEKRCHIFGLVRKKKSSNIRTIAHPRSMTTHHVQHNLAQKHVLEGIQRRRVVL